MSFISCDPPSGVSTCEGCRSWSGAPKLGKLRVFKLQELVRASNSFSDRNILGKGSHSIVYKAVLNDGEVVAVKRQTIGRRSLQDAISFDNELKILSRLRHRHLVNLIGFCNDSCEKLLVVEFMENGTLFDNLHSGSQPLSWPARVDMALQAAKALQALHSASPPIIHRDVKSSNILLDRDWNAKLSDLGLAVRGQLDDVKRQGNIPAGTMGYIDPEYQTPSQLSSKSDVFSFGILLLEIMSGRKAIDVRFNPSSLVDWAVPLIKQGNALDVCDTALEFPKNVEFVQQLGVIAYRAVRQSKDRRPTMAEVVAGLKRVRRKLPNPLFGRSLTVRRISIRKDEVLKEHKLRANDSSADVSKDKLYEDTSEWASFSKSEDVSGERTSSASDSERSSNSYGFMRKGCGDGDSDGQVSMKFTNKASLGGRLGTSKAESPVFDPNVSPTLVGSFVRVDLIRTSASSSLSGFAWNCGDQMTIRQAFIESPTYGSRRVVRPMDAWSSVASSRTYAQVSSGAPPRMSAQAANSRFKRDENSA